MCATFKNIVVLAVISVITEFAFAINNAYPSCRPRDTCIRLTECRPYMNLIRSLKRPLSPAAVVFLRRQECGFDGDYPMVCCFSTETVKSQDASVSYHEDTTKHSPPQTDYVEFGNDEKPQMPSKPDFTLTDMSDYTPTNDKSILFPQKDHFGSTTVNIKNPTTSTEKTRSKTKFPTWHLNDYVKFSTQRPVRKETKAKREEELQKKMDAINQAFAYNTMDYFFVRRMQESHKMKFTK